MGNGQRAGVLKFLSELLCSLCKECMKGVPCLDLSPAPDFSLHIYVKASEFDSVELPLPSTVDARWAARIVRWDPRDGVLQ